MYKRKQYGQSQINNCPFCNKTATAKNKQGVPVCSKHKDKYLDLKCVCGNWLDVKEGKWGPYCVCITCGNINFKKALEMNPLAKETSKEKKTISKPKETTIRSDDPNYF